MFILFYTALGVAAGFIGGRKGYNTGLCMLLGLVAPIGIIVAIALPVRRS